MDFYLILSLFVTLFAAACAATASYHVLMTKRDSRSALAWVGFCVLLPIIGPLLYLMFGINRVSKAAQKLYQSTVPPDSTRAIKEPAGTDFRPLSLVGESVTGKGLRSCNDIRMLVNGEKCFPTMLADIKNATDRVYCCTYIFQNDRVGDQFVRALKSAMARGVDVRVLIDGLGGIAYPPSVLGKLRRAKIPFERFNPITLVPPSLHINMRNHRKILLVDGNVAYTGGHNISERHLVEDTRNKHHTRDLHFRLTGKIVDEFERSFLKDWNHAAGITRQEPFTASNKNNSKAKIWTRLISDGPNDDLDKLTELLVGIMSTARKRLWIMTPYFLPSFDLVGALIAAELRGVDVKILLPQKTNIHLAHWAAMHNLRHILDRDLKVYLQPEPFIHTKAILIDDEYSLIGSANLDPRSLRLNFELVVEVFNKPFAREMADYFEQCLADCHLLDEEQLLARPNWEKTRNAIAWLFSPYL